MISVENAIELIDTNVRKTTQVEIIPVVNALGYTLSSNIYSPINMPPFRQSAMDGYALHLSGKNGYHVKGEVKAGDPHTLKLNAGEAVRIFTGAPVPDTANAVIMQEKVQKEGDQINLTSEVKEGTNIRPLGEQIKKGALALSAETKITPAAIAFLTTLGITKVSVYKKPSITIVTTGNELISPGNTLKHGQIYESNSVMLTSALQAIEFNNSTIYKVEDDYEQTLITLKNAIEKYDFLLISGGISVGDYDFVGKALIALKVQQLFYKIKQKPGKPLFFGKKENTIIFALPGNPASALSCFYVYVLPALRKTIGHSDYFLERQFYKLSATYEKKGERAEFLKACVKNDVVEILDGQASSMIYSFALANVLAYVPEHINKIEKGALIEVIKLP